MASNVETPSSPSFITSRPAPNAPDNALPAPTFAAKCVIVSVYGEATGGIAGGISGHPRPGDIREWGRRNGAVVRNRFSGGSGDGRLHKHHVRLGPRRHHGHLHRGPHQWGA